MSAWFTKNTNALLGLLGVLVVAIAARIAPDWLVERLDHIATRVVADPEASVSALLVFVGGLVSAIGMWRAAWQRDPNAAAAAPTKPERVSRTSGFARVQALAFVVGSVLAFLAGCSLLHGCTAAQSAEAFAIAKPALKWSCALANALCIKGNDDVACGIVAAGCGIAEPLLDAVAASSVTSGGEATDDPHDLDAEP